MSTHFGGRYTSVSQITGPSGFYTIWLNNEPVKVYVDQEYSGGGWVCVLANRAFTGGMSNLTFTDAVNKCNYRTGGSNQSAGPNYDFGKMTTLADYNIWIGTKFWPLLGYRLNSSYITVVQYVAGTNGVALGSTGSHNKRYRWQFGGWSSTYGFSSVSALSDETGTGAPGMYSYHAANGFSLTTYDMDRDAYGSNCSTMYNNNPWWYGACWDGNYFAGGGYADQANWAGAGSQLYQYGAVYIK
jgi:Fibrinogen beta and gamma chains, C-terminal globular domain